MAMWNDKFHFMTKSFHFYEIYRGRDLSFVHLSSFFLLIALILGNACLSMVRVIRTFISMLRTLSLFEDSLLGVEAVRCPTGIS